MTKFFIRPSIILTVYFGLTLFFGYMLLPFSLQNPTLKVELARLGLDTLSGTLDIAFFLYLIAFLFFCTGVFFVDRKIVSSKIINHISKFCVFPSKQTVLLIFILIVYTIIGTIGIFYTFNKTGVIPFFASDPLSAKHFIGVLDKYILYRPIYLISYMLVFVSSTMSIYLVTRQMSKGNQILIIFLIIGQMFILLLTMKRAILLGPLFSLSVAYALCGKSGVKGVLISFGCVIAISISMEYIGKTSTTTTATTATTAAATLNDFVYRISNNFFVEPREFARVLVHFEKKDFDFIYGKSYLAGFLGFLPSRISQFKSNNNIGRFTLKILGYNPSRGAIPRIGYVGEAYFNFGCLGVIFISFIFGCAVKFIDEIYFNLKRKNQNHLGSMLVLWLIFIKPSFGFLTSGTSEFAFAGLVLLLVLPFYLVYKQESHD